ncbi:ABC transporter ATP-binding protein [Phreatobacter stygius]|uniref:ABC transporter ATP-binding protein n=1 Tax=Phreatobacter stygius TaxID=1940610 RepID=A0A4D7B646_9HYPH|nr:ABC transporter ATP-binding protein [Phreatobacter stygius]QCI66585.1 ABC transporter ATP-binding protein [Phreatobacter stygius]
MKPPSPLLVVDGLRKRFGGLAATDGLSFEVAPGECLALIGPNGAGKTTAISQLFGEIRQDAGSIRFNGEIIDALPTPERVRRGIGRLYQIPQLLADDCVLDNVALAVQASQAHSFRFWRQARRDPRLVAPAMAVLDRVRLAGRAGARAADLSHGEQRTLELAIALARGSHLLLLDEPMAGLGPSETVEMTEVIEGLKRTHTILLVEHDMEAVFRLADRICVLVAGRVVASGTATQVRSDPQVLAAYLGTEAP